MIKVRWSRRSPRLATGVGLGLSLGLILGATGIIRWAAETPPAEARDSEAAAQPVERLDRRPSPDATPADPSRGHSAASRGEDGRALESSPGARTPSRKERTSSA